MRVSVVVFRTAEEFLEESDPDVHSCVIAETHLPGMSGLELQEMLQCSSRTTPFIFVSAHTTTRLVVRAMNNGAVGFLDKPAQEDELQQCVREAVRRDFAARRDRLHVRQLHSSFGNLTAQEEHVLRYIDDGLTNKEIAVRLDISVRTVESRRRQLFKKTGAENLPELIRQHNEFLRVTRSPVDLQRLF